MYADDTHLTYASNNIDDIDHHLNEDLAKVSEQLVANKLTLNQPKTEFMLIGSCQRISTFNSCPSLTINDIPIKQVSHRVLLDENLTWNVHIEKLCKKVASGIGALKHMRPFVPLSTMQLIYNCLVQPYFDYCCVVWDSCGSSLPDKLQKLQNGAARVLTSSNYDTNTEFPIEKLSWKNLESKGKIAKAIMLYKSLNGLVPDYLSEIFVDRSSVTNYTLRDTSRKLALAQPCTNYLKNSFSCSGSVLWRSKFKSACGNFIH
jgi:hypothetical protein